MASNPIWLFHDWKLFINSLLLVSKCTIKMYNKGRFLDIAFSLVRKQVELIWRFVLQDRVNMLISKLFQENMYSLNACLIQSTQYHYCNSKYSAIGFCLRTTTVSTTLLNAIPVHEMSWDGSLLSDNQISYSSENLANQTFVLGFQGLNSLCLVNTWTCLLTDDFKTLSWVAGRREASGVDRFLAHTDLSVHTQTMIRPIKYECTHQKTSQL